MKKQIFCKTLFKKNCLKMLYLMLAHLLCIAVNAQAKLYSKEAKISFFSKTAMENVEAQNKRALCVWDTATGQLEFSVLIKGFEFDRALMQEHFNENYMESDRFPKAAFKGELILKDKQSLLTDNNFKAQANGILTIHGVSKQVAVPVNISVKNGVIGSSAEFSVRPPDYKISIPAIVADKINKEIRISVLVPVYKKL
jgi:hypothetical protein